MRYLVKLRPLEPFLFGGEQTFGVLGDKEAGTYLVTSRQFPQQTAILGMVKKEIMIQAGVLTRKRKGEWVDKSKFDDAKKYVGTEKFDLSSDEEQDLGVIEAISPIFLMQNKKRYIKKVDIDTYPYIDGKLENYNPKYDIYDNFVSLDGGNALKSKNIFKSIEQTGNKKGGEENSLFKKTSYLLEDDIVFAFYIDVEYQLKNSLVHLGADRSAFMMEVVEDNTSFTYSDSKGYLVLLSDSYITIDIKEHCDFAITSEISHRNLTSKKSVLYSCEFEKSKTLYLYEKGSIFINPSDELLKNLNNTNLQKIGYNIHTQGEK